MLHFSRMNEYKNDQEFLENYGYDINGTWYPRVTKIVEIKAKPALYRFYAQLPSFEHGEAIKEQSAKEGTAVHEAVEAILMGTTDISTTSSIKPAIDAFLAFKEHLNIAVDPSLIEKRVANAKERYAGTVDALATIDGKFGILDIKTSQSAYRDYNLQTAAYMGALRDEFPTLSTRWILRIDQFQTCNKCGSTMRSKGGRDKVRLIWKPGDYTVRRKAERCEHEWADPKGDVELVESPVWENDFHAFLGAKRLWEWEHEEILKKIGYL